MSGETSNIEGVQSQVFAVHSILDVQPFCALIECIFGAWTLDAMTLDSWILDSELGLWIPGHWIPGHWIPQLGYMKGLIIPNVELSVILKVLRLKHVNKPQSISPSSSPHVFLKKNSK